MVSLKLLFIVDFQLNQAKKKKKNNIAMFGNLALIIIMGNFD